MTYLKYNYNYNYTKASHFFKGPIDDGKTKADKYNSFLWK